MKIIATRQLYGDYGALCAGDEADLNDDVARKLIERGLVAEPQLETPCIVPAETQSTSPAEQPSIKPLNKSKK